MNEGIELEWMQKGQVLRIAKHYGNEKTEQIFLALVPEVEQLKKFLEKKPEGT